jgi:hypothetical protein
MLMGFPSGIRRLALVCLTVVSVAVAVEAQQRMQRFGCFQRGELYFLQTIPSE